MRTVVLLLFMFVALFLIAASNISTAGSKEECFKTSLHHTTNGMRRWYNADDGFSAVTGVPYKELGCKNCHVSSCNDCHLQKTETGFEYSLAKARNSETCLKCHAREKATLGMDKKVDKVGVHMSSMSCADCHTKREVHGDGTCYESMRAPGAMDTKCTNCHTADATEYPAVPKTKSHTIHRGNLDCTACHVSNTMTCYNCHFGVLKETGKKSESFAAKAKDFLLLVKYNGKIVSGTLQTLVGPDNYPFVTYVPYFTHSVLPQGRKCAECHATEAVKTLAQGKTYKPVEFVDGKLVFKSGVIPLAPQQLEWLYLEKKAGKWVPFKPENKPLIQLGVYSEPLTDKEIKKMGKPRK